MRHLLDTHALLWRLFDDAGLSDRVRGILADPENEILVSGASAFEISTKYRLGRLEHARRAGLFPQPHRDPYDRMLAAQSMLECVPLISRDPALPPFGVELVW